MEWSELSLQNKRMTSFGLVKFLKDADIIPNLLSIEQLEEIMMKILVEFLKKKKIFFKPSFSFIIFKISIIFFNCFNL